MQDDIFQMIDKDIISITNQVSGMCLAQPQHVDYCKYKHIILPPDAVLPFSYIRRAFYLWPVLTGSVQIGTPRFFKGNVLPVLLFCSPDKAAKKDSKLYRIIHEHVAVTFKI